MQTCCRVLLSLCNVAGLSALLQWYDKAAFRTLHCPHTFHYLLKPRQMLTVLSNRVVSTVSSIVTGQPTC